MGLLADEDQALLWRGLDGPKGGRPVHPRRRLVGHRLLRHRHPPGTGDIAMTLARLLPQMGQLVVTTPATGRPAGRGARAADFARKSNIRVLGVIENMSGFTCSCGERHALLRRRRRSVASSDDLSVPLLAEIELNPLIAHAGDTRRPGGRSHESRPTASSTSLARRILEDVAPPAGAAGCSARMLDASSRHGGVGLSPRNPSPGNKIAKEPSRIDDARLQRVMSVCDLAKSRTSARAGEVRHRPRACGSSGRSSRSRRGRAPSGRHRADPPVGHRLARVVGRELVRSGPRPRRSACRSAGADPRA